MKRRFLHNTPLFAVLSDEERDLLAGRFSLRHFEDGAALFEAGEHAEAMYLVKSGMVRLFEQSSGERRLLATFGPSSALGEIDLLLDRAHGSTATAQGGVDAWVLSREALSSLMAERPAMSIKLSGFLGERIADVDPYLIERLQQVSILSDIGAEAQRALAQRLTLEEARRGALIYQAGADGEHLFLVESGMVTIVSTSPDDPEPFRQLGAGELFGHEAMLRGRAYGSVARAATDVQLWALDRAAWEQVATAHPVLRQVLSTHVSETALAVADREAARRALRQIPLFAGLSDSVMDGLVSRLSLLHVGTNETIYTASDPGNRFYLIDRGVVKLMDDAQLVARKEAGDYFGEMALLTGKARRHTARSARSTNLWVLEKRDFDAIAVRFPELTTAVSRVLGQSISREGDREAEAGINLSMFPLFTGLTPREQADVSRRVRPLSVARNEVLFRRGSVADALYLLQRGQVKLASEQGVFDLVRSGGFFGEMALLTGNSQNVTAQAVEDSDLLRLERNQFEAVLSRYPSVSLVLSRALSARLEAASARGVVPTAPVEVTTPIPTRGVSIEAEGEAEPPFDRPPRRSGWTTFKVLAVMTALLWLAGVAAPSLLIERLGPDGVEELRSRLPVVGAPAAPAEQAP